MDDSPRVQIGDCVEELAAEVDNVFFAESAGLQDAVEQLAAVGSEKGKQGRWQRQRSDIHSVGQQLGLVVAE
jgi:hypothetical protein